MKISKGLKRWLLTLFYLGFVTIPLWTKAYQVNQNIVEQTGTAGLGAWQSITNDAVVYAILFLLLFLTFTRFPGRIVSGIIRLFVIVALFINVCDVVVLKNYHTHLALRDVVKYASYSGKYAEQIGVANTFYIVLGAALIMGLIVFFVIDTRPSRKRAVPMLIAGLVFIAIIPFRGSREYPHSWIFMNPYEYNMMILPESRNYSEEFTAKTSFKEKKICATGKGQRPNIIILMVESLSSYQSDFFSGIEDWTPSLDSLAEENLAFTEFYANGFITEDGEVAMLTGRLPIYPPSSFTKGGSTSFRGFYAIDGALPQILAERGYETEFLTTSDLGFSNTGAWALSIGFEHVEGSEAGCYADLPRYHFNSVPDEALITRILDRVDEREDPFFIFVKTVSTHHPFIDPSTGEHDRAGTVFRYADRQIGRLARGLSDMGFFENGMLIITGDHHAMLPFSREEIELFGWDRAPHRVPLVIVNGIQDLEERPFQHVDIYNSIVNLTSDRICTSEWRGHLFGERIPPRYIAMRRGDNRSNVSVLADDKHYTVRLKGDRTKLLGEADDDLSAQITGRINALRISGLKRENGYMSSIHGAFKK